MLLNIQEKGNQFLLASSSIRYNLILKELDKWDSLVGSLRSIEEKEATTHSAATKDKLRKAAISSIKKVVLMLLKLTLLNVSSLSSNKCYTLRETKNTKSI